MIILITGSSHTGKTLLAQRLLEKYGLPYLSVDHLKMGLIRCGYCPLTPESDDASLTQYLWPITREIIKTAIENGQNLIVEGCYIPFDYRNDFETGYLHQIQSVCLIFSKAYIQQHYDDIARYSCQIERRMENACPSKNTLIKENSANPQACTEHGLDYILIRDKYQVDWEPHF